MKTAFDLIYLVTCAVNEQTPDAERLADIDLDKLSGLAEFHGLSSAAAYALEKAVQLPRAFDIAKKKAIQRQALFSIERTRVLSALSQRGIWYMPLKGIVLSGLYPKSSMREMLDNDILCDSSRMADVREIMESLGFTCEGYETYCHDNYIKPPSLEFEMHRALFDTDLVPEFAVYYRDVFDRLIKNGDGSYEYHMTDEDIYIYLICHLYKHYTYAGTGLRNLLDIYLYNRSFYGSMDKEYISKELEKLSLSSFEESARTLSEKIFTLSSLSDTELKVLSYYINSGACGDPGHYKHNKLRRALSSDDSKGSKRRFLINNVFISGEELQERYPFVYKHKALYPLLFIYRPIKGVITHPKSIMSEYKYIKSFKVDKDKDF